MSTPPALVVTAAERHGVTIAARDLAVAVEESTGRDLRVEAAALLGEDPPSRAHLHFTDRLWAGSPEEAASVVERIAGRTALTVTLHDVPQVSDGPRNLPRRTECYARVVAAARGVVVNSRHEAAHLAEAGITARVLGVVPLPVAPAPPAPRPAAGAPDVAVLGFFYPGKGHAEVVNAVAGAGTSGVQGAATPRTPSFDAAVSGAGSSGVQGAATPRTSVRVTVLGGPSAGHEGDLREFVEGAAARGVAVDVTGFVPEEELVARCRGVAVPVAAHRHFSASGSIATWIAAGRRPIVTDGRYAREMAALRPGTMHLVAPGDLPEAIAKALADPDSTWLAPDAVTRPHLDDTADAYVRWWTKEVPW